MLKNCIFASSGEEESGNAGEQPDRNNLTDGDDSEGATNAPSTPLNHLCPLCLKKLTQN